MKLIPQKDRSKRPCYFCGDIRSVKYLLTVNILDDRGEKIEELKDIPTCTRCALLYIARRCKR